MYCSIKLPTCISTFILDVSLAFMTYKISSTILQIASLFYFSLALFGAFFRLENRYHFLFSVDMQFLVSRQHAPMLI